MAPARSLGGLRVLITGASSGIGACVSSLLADRGVRVFGTGRDAAALATSGAQFEASMAQDLVEAGAPGTIVSAAVEALGGLDVVISNAGAGWSGPFESMSGKEIDSLLDINLRVPVHLAHASAGHLRASAAGGQLVLVGSIAGLVGVAEEVAYSSAKSGLRGLAESLRAEWRGAGRAGPGPVTVSLVSPGAVDTPFLTRRNRPYMRSWPKPVPVETAAAVIVRAIEYRLDDVVFPPWLTLPARLNGGLPALYRALARLEARFE
jgi:NAD(P)-dependent dehydrogenase (short-subunit alcohol dehydrogenase family)